MNVRRVIPPFVGVVAVATAAVLVTSATTLVTAHAAADFSPSLTLANIGYMHLPETQDRVPLIRAAPHF